MKEGSSLTADFFGPGVHYESSELEACVGSVYSGRGALLYHALTQSDNSEIRPLVDVLRGTVGPIVELACGSGRVTIPLLQLRRPITALDSSKDLLTILRARFQELCVERSGEIDVMSVDLSLPHWERALKGKCGAVVMATTSIGLFSQEERARILSGIAASLLPKATVCISLAEHPIEAEGAGVFHEVPGFGTIVTARFELSENRTIFIMREGRDGNFRFYGNATHRLSKSAFLEECATFGLQLCSSIPINQSSNILVLNAAEV